MGNRIGSLGNKTSDCSIEEAINPEINDVVRLISNTRRRIALIYLENNYSVGDTAHIGEISDGIADILIESEYSDRTDKSPTRKAVYVGLYQTHIEKFDELGIVNYNKKRKEIEIQERIHQYIDLIDQTIDWYDNLK